MTANPIRHTHVAPLPVAGSLASRRLVFVHIPKTAGTTFDSVLESVSRLGGGKRFRSMGTVYGQFLGEGKQDATDSFRAADARYVDNAAYLAGHVPAAVWEERIDADGAAFVTLLRDPVERMISQYRFGIERGGWSADAGIADLVAGGALAGNLQVRMLAGCGDAETPCDRAMLQAALDRLEQRSSA